MKQREALLRDFHPCQAVFVFIVDDLGVERIAQRGCEDLNEEQTATLETALLHAA